MVLLAFSLPFLTMLCMFALAWLLTVLTTRHEKF
jgi:hypothetical protein